MATNILIYNEFRDDSEDIKKVYPDGLHKVIGDIFSTGDFNVKYTFVDDVNDTITDELLSETDVLIWWGHCFHGDITDKTADIIANAVKKGMGLISLHSAHLSKPLTRLLGSSCTLSWRVGDKERIWTVSPYHPIAKGIPEHFELPIEEMYGEPFDIPNPEDTVFVGWFSGGNVFRSGVTFRRGYGKIFYFQPGHETFPIYYDENIRKIIKNAVMWAKPEIRRENLDCPNTASYEN